VSFQTPCYDVYRTSDGFISVGSLEPKFWSAFCTAIERTDLIARQFPENETELQQVKAEVQKVLASKNNQQWREFFRHKDCCVEIGA
jgi:alpha-methylacyl-CoA racemase